MILAAFPASIAGTKYTKALYSFNMEHINEERQLGYCQSVATDKAYMQQMRLYNTGAVLKEKYKRLWKELFKQKSGIARRRAISTGILECLPEAVIIYAGISIALGVLSGNSTIGDYSLYTGLLGQLWASIYLLSSSVIQIYDNKLKIENIKVVQGLKNHVEDAGALDLGAINSIEFRHVSFAYPETEALVLNDVSFAVKQNEKIALVGLNGSGKSTLIKLLLRMYEPTIGTILINGHDIKEYKLAALRVNFSVYFQSMFNFWFTIKENFILSDDGSADTDASILSALNMSSCDDILKKANSSLDTSVTKFFDPDGIELSGGQYQKLALARTLYRRHSVLVPDEPSANLDPKAEHDIFESLKTFTDGKITIFTSHRLSNVFLAERIIVLENGAIIEDGTQAELLKNKNRYAELYRYQQEKFLVKQEV